MNASDETWDTIACGADGRVSIVLMSRGHPMVSRCEVSLGQTDVCFEVGSHDVLRAIRDFLNHHSSRLIRAEESIGRFSGCSVVLVKGDIHPQEFHLLARGDDVFFDVLFALDDSASLSRAIDLAVEDLSTSRENA